MSHHRQSAYLYLHSELIIQGLPLAIRLKASFNVYDDLLKDWCFAEDLDSFEHIGMEAANLVLGPVRAPFTCINQSSYFADDLGVTFSGWRLRTTR
jgi:hypothetical protein